MIMWPMSEAETSEIIMEHLGDTLVTQGKHEFNLLINTTQVDEELRDLQRITKNWYVTCNRLTTFLVKLQCIPIYEKQEAARKKLQETQNYIKSFFAKHRSKRSWSFWNDMDTEDRIRIDKDLDKLRHNEENLKATLDHQTAALDEMYKLVNKSVLSVDEEALTLIRNPVCKNTKI